MDISFQYPKSARLLKSREYVYAQRQGKKLYSEDLAFQLVQTQAKKGARLGLTVSRKYGHSVVRNLFKRRLKEIFRLSRPYLGLGLIIHIRPLGKVQHPSQVPSFANLKAQWQQTLAPHFLPTPTTPDSQGDA